jgi:hypothetical protein
MSIEQAQYEALLAEYSDHRAIVKLLKLYRPYLEMIPSMRRPHASIISLPLPLVRVRHETKGVMGPLSITEQLPCDIAILMCDPEWKVKTGIELCLLLHRPQETFSELLARWRRTQVTLSQPYEWIMPPRHQHVLNEFGATVYPLFVILESTPELIRRGLRGAELPFVTAHPAPELVMIDERDIPDVPASFGEVLGEAANS